MQQEEKQFFDGMLLGALVVGFIIVVVIAIILFYGDPQVGGQGIERFKYSLPEVQAKESVQYPGRIQIVNGAVSLQK